MLESIFSTTTATTTLSLINVIMAITIAFVSGGIISLTYMKTQKKHSQNFALTVILLPAIISIIIMLIGSDIARAFSLAGAFSIIRFRSAPGEPKDIAYVLFAMAAGLAAGAGAVIYALVFTLILCMVMLTLDKIGFGSKKNNTKVLQITIPEDLNYDSLFDDLFEKYTQSYELTQIKSASMGSLFVLTYELLLTDITTTKAFIDELRCRNGNLAIKLANATEVVVS